MVPRWKMKTVYRSSVGLAKGWKYICLVFLSVMENKLVRLIEENALSHLT